MEGVKIINGLILIANLIRILNSQLISVDLNDSMLVNSQNLGISVIASDFEGNFIVCFEGGTAQIFSSNFSTFRSISFPETVQSLQTRTFTMPGTTLSNGTLISMSNRSIAILSNGRSTLRDINYHTYQTMRVYNFNESMILENGYPLTVSGVTQYFHVIVFKDSIKLAYGDTIITQISFGSLFGANTICLTAINYRRLMSVSGDNINGNLTHFISLNNSNVYRFYILFRFRFNFTLNRYSLNSFSYTHTLIYASPTPINVLRSASVLVFMQSNSTGATAVFSVTLGSLGTTVNIPPKQTFSFLFGLGTFYIIQSNGISTLSYNSTSNILSYSSLVTSLPQNTYNLIMGNFIAPFYIPGQPYLYKGGLCRGQSLMNGSFPCVTYSCLVNNCSSCRISPYICTVCQQGYQLNENYTCNEINNTIFDILRQSLAFLQQPLIATIELLSDTISFPATRRIVPFFVCFGIFDDLYLFQFHDRLYGSTMNSLFSYITEIQNKKWSFVNYKEMLQLFNVNYSNFENIVNYQDEYTYYSFTHEDHASVGPQGLWGNCQNFFVVAIPITIVSFLILRIIFKILFRYRVSKILRNFQFWPFLFILIFEGNIQQLSFYMVADWINTFFFDYSSKWIKMQVIFFGFVFFVMTVCLYYLSYGIYKKLNSYLMQNHLNNLTGQTFYILQSGFKNMLFGVMHSLLRKLEYRQMLVILFANQLLFSTIFVMAMSKKTYKMQLKIWIYVLLNLFKILQMLTLYFDYQNINDPVIESVQLILILLEVGVFVLGGLVEVIITIKQCFCYIKNTIFPNKEESQKNESQMKANKYLQYRRSVKGVTIYVKNFKQSSQPRQFKIKSYNFSRPIRQAPIVIQKNKTFKFNNNLTQKLKRQNLQPKKKYLRINYTQQNIAKFESSQ